MLGEWLNPTPRKEGYIVLIFLHQMSTCVNIKKNNEMMFVFGTQADDFNTFHCKVMSLKELLAGGPTCTSLHEKMSIIDK